MSKGVCGVWNPKTVTLTTALIQWLADCQIYSPFPYAPWLALRALGVLELARGARAAEHRVEQADAHGAHVAEAPWSVAEWAVAPRFHKPRATVLLLG